MGKIIAMMLLCLAILFGSAAYAKADETDSSIWGYKNGEVVCLVLTPVTDESIRIAGNILTSQGYSGKFAAYAVYESIMWHCPEKWEQVKNARAQGGSQLV